MVYGFWKFSFPTIVCNHGACVTETVQNLLTLEIYFSIITQLHDMNQHFKVNCCIIKQRGRSAWVLLSLDIELLLQEASG